MFDKTFGSLSPRTRRGAVLSQMKFWILALLLVVGLVGSTNAAHAQGNLQITDITLAPGGGGQYTGTLAGFQFTRPIKNWSLLPGDVLLGECAILSLELNPIHLELLGLNVDTSAICLKITADGDEGLLGELLCGIAGGLLPLDLDFLEELLLDLINDALNQARVVRGSSNGDICTGQCEILFLSLGPVNLNLLGLEVELDDCANGPVQICVSASRGEGILGDLLCGLTGPQLGHLNLADITRLVQRALQLLPGGLTRAEIADLTALLGRLLRN